MIQKKRKIAVLGTGNVGATIAYTIAMQGIASEIVLVDINKEKAEGEALDISQCAACAPSCKVWSGEYEDVKDSDIIVVTFGVGRKPGQSRLDLAKINIGILKSVMPNVAKIAPKALYVIVSNPVDVLTYVTLKCTNLKKEQVIGTGTLLDSNRLSQAVASYCKVDTSSVNAYVLGEHGDACMAPWSLCTIGGVPVKTYAKKFLKVSKEELNNELEGIYTGMVQSGAKVIKAKGATYYAIAASVVKLIKALLSDSNAILPLSTLLKGEYGANDMCMGVPCIVNASGLKQVVKLPLDKDEEKLFSEKIASLDATYNALEIR
ncbi:MAG: L-lactate dehydrogenase [Firmicutes bacterium]|nr:L-lactate dehydrogenase [Candidatus Caballimonas caccae]